LSSYTHHRCRCEDCRRAFNVYQKSRRARLRIKGATAHGTVSSYTNYGCRCVDCCDTWRVYQRAYRQAGFLQPERR
jgi:hypothetical protein